MRALAHGLRVMRRRPLASLVSALCLGVGLGACAIAWTLLDATVMRPFGLRDTSRLAVLWETNPALNQDLIEVSLPNFLDWQRESKTVESMAAFGSSHWPVLARIGDDTRPLAARAVSTSFFATIGVSPALGRDFTPADVSPGVTPPVILSHQTWQTRFHGSPSIVGQSVFLDGTDHRIIGVMPRGFGFPDDPDAWTTVELELGDALKNLPESQQRQVGVLEVVGRRRPDVSNDQVRDEIGGIVRALRQRHGAKDLETRAALTPFADVLVGRLGARLWIAGAMAIVVWLFACANVAGVRLAQGRERAAELSARVFLGASRARVIRDLALEFVPMTAGTAVLAAVIWFGVVSALITSPVIAESGVDLLGERVEAGAVIVVFAGLTWILVGVLPAWWNARGAVAGSTAAPARITARSSVVGAPLVLGEAALAITVVAVATAAVQSFDRLSRIDLGFATSGVTFVDISVPRWKYGKPQDLRTLLARLEESLRQMPAHRSVASVSVRPFRFGEIADGQPVRRSEDTLVEVDRATSASRVISTSDYFTAIGLPIVEGRAFSTADRTETSAVVIVSRTLARTLWGDDPPVGKRVDTYSLSEKWRTRTVVGVAGDARYRGLERPSLEIYVPDTQAPVPIGSFVIGHDRAAMPTEAAIRQALRRVEPEIAIERVQSSGQVHRAVLSPARLLATLMSVLGAAGVLLLALGIFGAVAGALRAAWGEIAVRQAIGARPFQAARAPVRLLAQSLVAGIAAGLALTPLVLAGAVAIGWTREGGLVVPAIAAAAIVLVVAVAATAPSLRRAARSSPAELLRQV